jgi:ubiquinone biosynthesis protein COQ9
MTGDASPPQGDWTAEAEQRLLDAALGLAPSLGWGSAMIARAAPLAGLSAGEALLVLPNGARDLAALLSRRHDAASLAALAATDPRSLKIRERITRAVEARLDAAAANGAAVRRWAGFLALPFNLALAGRLVWESADVIWRWAGDVAVDENHYSKRAILSAILVSTLAIRLSSGREAASAYLAARIGDVMRFETWKARLKPADFGVELAAALGRLRYGKA